jgi:2-phospho-L-lactate/phosphoenolpyruvate guanylyltransferase
MVRWTVLLAVKPLPLAKSRLDRPDRSALTLAMAADTAQAAARVAAVEVVLVVTDDPDARAMLEPVAVVIPDAPNAGLNPALRHAAAEAGSRWPHTGVVVLAADLPALRPEALAAALERAAQHQRAVVADAVGTGTVLLSAAAGLSLEPSFGPGSRQRHRGSGAVDLTDSLPPGDPTEGLRHDVDTAADLEAAIRIGVGPRTARVLAQDLQFTLGWQTAPVTESAPAPHARPRT